MIRLIQFLLSGCFHQWEVIKQTRADYNHFWNWGTTDQYTLRCKKCGAMKTFLAK